MRSFEDASPPPHVCLAPFIAKALSISSTEMDAQKVEKLNRQSSSRSRDENVTWKSELQNLLDALSPAGVSSDNDRASTDDKRPQQFVPSVVDSDGEPSLPEPRKVDRVWRGYIPTGLALSIGLWEGVPGTVILIADGDGVVEDENSDLIGLALTHIEGQCLNKLDGWSPSDPDVCIQIVYSALQMREETLVALRLPLRRSYAVDLTCSIPKFELLLLYDSGRPQVHVLLLGVVFQSAAASYGDPQEVVTRAKLSHFDATNPQPTDCLAHSDDKLSVFGFEIVHFEDCPDCTDCTVWLTSCPSLDLRYQYSSETECSPTSSVATSSFEELVTSPKWMHRIESSCSEHTLLSQHALSHRIKQHVLAERLVRFKLLARSEADRLETDARNNSIEDVLRPGLWVCANTLSPPNSAADLTQRSSKVGVGSFTAFLSECEMSMPSPRDLVEFGDAWCWSCNATLWCGGFLAFPNITDDTMDDVLNWEVDDRILRANFLAQEEAVRADTNFSSTGMVQIWWAYDLQIGIASVSITATNGESSTSIAPCLRRLIVDLGSLEVSSRNASEQNPIVAWDDDFPSLKSNFTLETHGVHPRTTSLSIVSPDMSSSSKHRSSTETTVPRLQHLALRNSYDAVLECIEISAQIGVEQTGSERSIQIITIPSLELCAVSFRTLNKAKEDQESFFSYDLLRATICCQALDIYVTPSRYPHMIAAANLSTDCIDVFNDFLKTFNAVPDMWCDDPQHDTRTNFEGEEKVAKDDIQRAVFDIVSQVLGCEARSWTSNPSALAAAPSDDVSDHLATFLDVESSLEVYEALMESKVLRDDTSGGWSSTRLPRTCMLCCENIEELIELIELVFGLNDDHSSIGSTLDQTRAFDLCSKAKGQRLCTLGDLASVSECRLEFRIEKIAVKVEDRACLTMHQIKFRIHTSSKVETPELLAAAILRSNRNSLCADLTDISSLQKASGGNYPLLVFGLNGAYSERLRAKRRLNDDLSFSISVTIVDIGLVVSTILGNSQVIRRLFASTSTAHKQRYRRSENYTKVSRGDGGFAYVPSSNKLGLHTEGQAPMVHLYLCSAPTSQSSFSPSVKHARAWGRDKVAEDKAHSGERDLKCWSSRGELRILTKFMQKEYLRFREEEMAIFESHLAERICTALKLKHPNERTFTKSSTTVLLRKAQKYNIDHPKCLNLVADQARIDLSHHISGGASRTSARSRAPKFSAAANSTGKLFASLCSDAVHGGAFDKGSKLRQAVLMALDEMECSASAGAALLAFDRAYDTNVFITQGDPVFSKVHSWSAGSSGTSSRLQQLLSIACDFQKEDFAASNDLDGCSELELRPPSALEVCVRFSDAIVEFAFPAADVVLAITREFADLSTSSTCEGNCADDAQPPKQIASCFGGIGFFVSLHRVQLLVHEPDTEVKNTKNTFQGDGAEKSGESGTMRKEMKHAASSIRISMKAGYLARQMLETAGMQIDSLSVGLLQYLRPPYAGDAPAQNGMFSKTARGLAAFRQMGIDDSPANAAPTYHALVKPWEIILLYSLHRDTLIASGREQNVVRVETEPRLKRKISGEMRTLRTQFWTTDPPILLRYLSTVREGLEDFSSKVYLPSKSDDNEALNDKNHHPAPLNLSEQIERARSAGDSSNDGIEEKRESDVNAISSGVVDAARKLYNTGTISKAEYVSIVGADVVYNSVERQQFIEKQIEAGLYTDSAANDCCRNVDTAAVTEVRRPISLFSILFGDAVMLSDTYWFARSNEACLVLRSASKASATKTNFSECSIAMSLNRWVAKCEGKLGLNGAHWSFSQALSADDTMHGGDGTGDAKVLVEFAVDEYISVDLSGIEIEIVEGVLKAIPLETFLPVILLRVEGIRFVAESASLFERDVASMIQASCSALFYNRRLSCFEPLLEPWNGRVTVFRSSFSQALEIDLKADHRMNVNISEDVLELLVRISEQLSDNKVRMDAVHFSSENTPSSKLLGLNSISRREALEGEASDPAEASDYWLLNDTGVELRVHDTYEIGCGTSGRLFVTIRDGWFLPSRVRWVSRPEVRLTLLPWIEISAASPEFTLKKSKLFDWQDCSAPNDDRYLTFELEYPGTDSGEVVPHLGIEISLAEPDGRIFLSGEINLVKHLVFCNDVGANEWYKLADTRNPLADAAEVLISLRFESDAPASEQIELDEACAAQIRTHSIPSGDATPIQFASSRQATAHSRMQWFGRVGQRELYQQISQIGETTLRRVALDFTSIFGQDGASALLSKPPLPLRLLAPIDNSGYFMLSTVLPNSRILGGNFNHPIKQRTFNLCLISARRDMKKRLLVLQSPLTLRNDTSHDIEILISPSEEPTAINSQNFDYSKPHSRFGSLRRVPAHATVVQGSGNFLDEYGMGISALFVPHDRAPTDLHVDEGIAKSQGGMVQKLEIVGGWVDGGHPRSKRKPGVDNQSSFAEISDLTSKRMSILKSAKIMGISPSAVIKAQATRLEGEQDLGNATSESHCVESSSSWLEFVFEDGPHLVCMYSFAPVARWSSSSDSAFALPPSGWVLYGGTDINSEWEEVDRRSNVRWNPCAHTSGSEDGSLSEFWCTEVGFYSRYKIVFETTPRWTSLEPPLDEKLSDEEAKVKWRAARRAHKWRRGPAGRHAIGLRCVNLWEDPNERQGRPEQDIDPENQAVGASLDDRESWTCALCGDTNVFTRGEVAEGSSVRARCSLCDCERDERWAASLKESPFHHCPNGSHSSNNLALKLSSRADTNVTESGNTREEASAADENIALKNDSLTPAKNERPRSRSAVDAMRLDVRSRYAPFSQDGSKSEDSPSAPSPLLSPISTADTVLKEGFLKKRARRSDLNWKTRWMQLTTAHIRYFRRPATGSKALKRFDTNYRGEFELTPFTQMKAFSEKMHPFCLKLISYESYAQTVLLPEREMRERGRTLILSATTFRELRSWERSISAVLHRLLAFRAAEQAEKETGKKMRNSTPEKTTMVLRAGKVMSMPVNFLFGLGNSSSEVRGWSVYARPHDPLSRSQIAERLARRRKNLHRDSYPRGESESNKGGGMYEGMKWSLIYKDLSDDIWLDVGGESGKERELMAYNRDRVPRTIHCTRPVTPRIIRRPEFESPAHVPPNVLQAQRYARVGGFSMSTNLVQRMLQRFVAGAKEEAVEGGLVDKISSKAFDDERSLMARCELHLKPWLVVQNALPYDMELRFQSRGSRKDDQSMSASIEEAASRLSVVSDVHVLKPGAEEGFCTADNHSKIQFRVSRMNTSWSNAVDILKYRRFLKSGGDARGELLLEQPIEFWSNEIADLDRTANNVQFTLTLERSRDNLGPWRLLLFAQCWVYNFSDCDVVLRSSRNKVQHIIDDTFGLNSNTAAESESHVTLFPANFFAQDEVPFKEGNAADEELSPAERRLLPALANFGRKEVMIAGALRERSALLSTTRAVKSFESSKKMCVQDCLNNWPETCKHDFSRASLSPFASFLLLDNQVTDQQFSFLTAKGFLRRQVGVGVRSPSGAFRRSYRVIIRTRYVLVNLTDCNLLFKQLSFYEAKRSGTATKARLEELKSRFDAKKIALRDGDPSFEEATRDASAALISVEMAERKEAAHSMGVENEAQSEQGGKAMREAEDTAFMKVVERMNSDAQVLADEDSEMQNVIKNETHDISTHDQFVEGTQFLPATGIHTPVHFNMATLAKRRFFAIRAEGTRCSGPLAVEMSLDVSDMDTVVLLRSAADFPSSESPSSQTEMLVDPRPDSGARRIRVLLRGVYGTIFVVFTNDNEDEPNYRVVNNSSFGVEVRQQKAPVSWGNLIIPPGEARPLAWDLPQEFRKVCIRALEPIQASVLKRAIFASQNDRNVEVGKSKPLRKITCKGTSSLSTTLREIRPFIGGQCNNNELVVQSGSESVIQQMIDHVKKTSNEASPDHSVNVGASIEDCPEENDHIPDALRDGGKDFFQAQVWRTVSLGAFKYDFTNVQEMDPLVLDERLGTTRSRLIGRNPQRTNNDLQVEVVVRGSTRSLELRNSGASRSRWSDPNSGPSEHLKSERAYTVRIKVLEASSLRAADSALKTLVKTGSLVRSSDPYLKVSCGGRHGTSVTKSATLNPNWHGDEAFFEFDTSTPPKEVQIAVYDHARVLALHNFLVFRSETLTQFSLPTNLRSTQDDLSADEFLGSASVPLPRALWRTFSQISSSQQRAMIRVNSVEWISILRTEADQQRRRRRAVQRWLGDSLEGSKGSSAQDPSAKGRDTDDFVDDFLVEEEDPTEPHRKRANGMLRLMRHGKSAGLVVAEVECIKHTSDEEPPSVEFSLTLPSVAFSLIHAARQKELAYLCIQRIRFAIRSVAMTRDIRASIGHFQLDNYSAGETKYPVIIAPKPLPPASERGFWPLKDVVSLRALVHTFDPRVLQLDVFEVTLEPLDVCIDIKFVASILNMNTTGQLQGLGHFIEGESSLTHPQPLQFGWKELRQQTSGQMIYIDQLHISSVAITLSVDSEGSNEAFKNQDQLTVTFTTLFNSIRFEADNLTIRIKAFEQSGYFKPMAAFVREVLYHVIKAIALQLPKLVSGSAYTAPVKVFVSVFTSIVNVLLGPFNPCRRSLLRNGEGAERLPQACMQRLRNDFSLLVANTAGGITEVFEVASSLAVDIGDSLGEVGRRDLAIMPIINVFRTINTVAGAISSGASQISHELVYREKGGRTMVHIREPRGFSRRGNIVFYGPANVPHEIQRKRERIAAFRIGSWWRNVSLKKRDPYFQSLLRAQNLRHRREAAARAGQTRYQRAREAAGTELSRAAKYFADLRAYDKYGDAE